MTDTTVPPSPTITLTAPEFQALLQLATWHRVCLDALQQAFTAGDMDRAMWTLQLLLQHPCAARDAELVRGVCERAWPMIFGCPRAGHVERLKTQIASEVESLREQAKAEPAPKLFLVPSKPAKDLPS